MPSDLTRTSTALWVGALIGLLSGLVVAVYFSVAGEPRIEDAIAIEQANAVTAGEAEDHHEGATEVSRSAQRGVGLFAAMALAGGAFGAIFGAVFAVMRAQRDLFRRALVAGAILATATTVVPWFKYPPNPPAVGDPNTVGRRQLLYVLLIILTGVVWFVALEVHKRLADQAVAEPRRWTIAAVAFIVPLAFVLAVLPSNDDPIVVPASLIWEFRLVSLAGNVLRWALLAVAFGLFASRAASAAERSPLVTAA